MIVSAQTQRLHVEETQGVDDDGGEEGPDSLLARKGLSDTDVL